MKLSGYIPCYNNAACIEQAIRSIQCQEMPVDDLMVVDDGSTDRSPVLAEKMGARIIRLEKNFGRGAVNARAINEAKHELVLCMGATNVLPPEFSKRAQAWFVDASVAAVYGRVISPPSADVVNRWRGRHLFKEHTVGKVERRASLISTGSMFRKSAVMAVGNFNAALRHSEDEDLGRRLLSEKWDVIADPELCVIAGEDNTLFRVLERYWRWHAGKDEEISWKAYFRQIAYSIKVMAREDLQARDPLGIPVSLFSPHYQFWKSWAREKLSKP